MKQQKCKRCGTCCKKGGPILHSEDLPLFHEKILSLERLVTIRKGELSFNPIKNIVEPAGQELIKIAGKNGSWECVFYDDVQSACTIHKNRPIECRLLQCWDTEAIKNISGKNCLNRFDLLKIDDKLKELITLHEQNCSWDKVNSLLLHLSDQAQQADVIKKLTDIMQEDLIIRDKAVSQFRLTLQQELFYLGRPLFQALQYPGLKVSFEGNSLRLTATQ